MSILYAGGLWTIFFAIALISGYIWVLNGPKRAYKALLLAGALVILLSQMLPESHTFRIRVAEGLHWWFWATTIALPVLAYAMFVRWIKRKADMKNDT